MTTVQFAHLGVCVRTRSETNLLWLSLRQIKGNQGHLRSVWAFHCDSRRRFGRLGSGLKLSSLVFRHLCVPFHVHFDQFIPPKQVCEGHSNDSTPAGGFSFCFGPPIEFLNSRCSSLVASVPSQFAVTCRSSLLLICSYDWATVQNNTIPSLAVYPHTSSIPTIFSLRLQLVPFFLSARCHTNNFVGIKVSVIVRRHKNVVLLIYAEHRNPIPQT